MNELMIFDNPKFGNIRTIEEDGGVLFCGSDVARALGYKRPKDAIAAHCKGAVKRRTHTEGGEQEMVFVREGDIYRLAARSKLPGADEFERWIFDEVIPQRSQERRVHQRAREHDTARVDGGGAVNGTENH